VQPDLRPAAAGRIGTLAKGQARRRSRNTRNEAKSLGRFQTVLLVLCLLCLQASEVLPEGGGCLF
jgi:hypothetical protein